MPHSKLPAIIEKNSGAMDYIAGLEKRASNAASTARAAKAELVSTSRLLYEGGGVIAGAAVAGVVDAKGMPIPFGESSIPMSGVVGFAELLFGVFAGYPFLAAMGEGMLAPHVYDAAYRAVMKRSADE